MKAIAKYTELVYVECYTELYTEERSGLCILLVEKCMLIIRILVICDIMKPYYYLQGLLG